MRPNIGLRLLPFITIFKQSRNIRPTVKIGREKFQISIDVHQFTKDEIRVKARPEFVIIEGKQERKTKCGYVLRRFVRKFKLPSGCAPSKMKSCLSKDGILTVTAPRDVCDMNYPCETVVPISHSGEVKRNEESIIVMDKKEEPCKQFMDDKKGGDKK